MLMFVAIRYFYKKQGLLVRDLPLKKVVCIEKKQPHLARWLNLILYNFYNDYCFCFKEMSVL